MKIIKVIKSKQEKVKFHFPVVTDVQEVEELLQGYDLSYKFEDAEGPYPSLTVTGDKKEIIRFAKEVMIGNWEHDEDAREFVDKFMPEIKKLESLNIDVEDLVLDAETLFTYDEDHLDYEFIQYMGYPQVGGFDLDDIKKMIRRDPKRAAKFIRKYIN